MKKPSVVEDEVVEQDAAEGTAEPALHVLDVEDRAPSFGERLKRSASKLYNWVALMIVLGALLGHFYPAAGVAMQPLADGFIALIKMLIPAVILCTVVLGIAGSGSIKKAGRVGGKAIIYFEVVSTFALVIGLGMANFFGPGRSFHADPSKLDPKLVANYVSQAQNMTVKDHLLKIIPKTLFSAFTEGDILQVLLISVLLGFALARLGDKYKTPLMDFMGNVVRRHAADPVRRANRCRGRHRIHHR